MWKCSIIASETVNWWRRSSISSKSIRDGMIFTIEFEGWTSHESQVRRLAEICQGRDAALGLEAQLRYYYNYLPNQLCGHNIESRLFDSSTGRLTKRKATSTEPENHQWPSPAVYSRPKFMARIRGFLGAVAREEHARPRLPSLPPAVHSTIARMKSFQLSPKPS